MIIGSRRYEREAPSRDARKVYIFCEGRKTEYKYFRFFFEMDSRISLTVFQMGEEDNTTPAGVLEKAKEFYKTTGIIDIDEVWLVFDRDYDKRDSRKPQIEKVREECASLENCRVALSNPCFEVWLYYHFSADVPDFEGLNVSVNWKRYLADTVLGGFDTRKHPVLIETALANARAVYLEDESGEPVVCSTEVYKLAESIVPLVKEKLQLLHGRHNG